MRKIIRRLSLFVGVISLIAVALPAVSSATELQAESEPGEPLPVGTEILLQSENTRVSNAWFTELSCTRMTLLGWLGKNGPETVELEGGGGFAEGCEGAGEGYTLEELTLQSFTLGGSGEGTISLSFTWRIGAFECPYEGEGPVGYQTGTDVVSLDKVPLESPYEFCEPEGGHPELSGDFSLSNPKGPALIVNSTPKWTVQSTPSSVSGQLSDVSCASADECVAVGFEYESGARKALAERWDGSEWATMPAAGNKQLEGVSCTSATFCVAIPNDLEAQRWNGSAWSAMTLSTPPEAADASLRDISCVRLSLCMAVGSYSLPNGKIHALAERYDGEEWTILTPPTEEGTRLDTVSCDGLSASCTTIGRKGEEAVALRWKDAWPAGKWSTMAAPKQAGADISCTHPWSCMKVGVTSERWNGSEWVYTPIAEPEGISWLELESVSCRPAGCIATGYYLEEGEGGELSLHPLAERWNGSEWVLQEAADPGSDAALMGVSCTSVGRCTAVGTVFEGESQTPLAERFQ